MPFDKLELHHGPLTFSALAQGKGPVVLCLHGFARELVASPLNNRRRR